MAGIATHVSLRSDCGYEDAAQPHCSRHSVQRKPTADLNDVQEHLTCIRLVLMLSSDV